MSLLATLIITRKDIDARVFRTPGLLYQERGTDSISNLYNIKFANKTLKDLPLTVRLKNEPGRIQMIGKAIIQVAKEGQGSGSFFVVLPKSFIHKRKTNIKLLLYEGNNVLSEVSTSFLGPVE